MSWFEPRHIISLEKRAPTLHYPQHERAHSVSVSMKDKTGKDRIGDDDMGSERGTIADDGQAIICFASGTMMSTERGQRRIETLARGDLVLTLDRGPQPIRWIWSRTVRASGVYAPVRIARGTLGNTRDLLVSPHHRMLLTGAAARAHGSDQVLAPAHALIDDYRISAQYGGMVTYHHMLFDRHEIVIANGVSSESFHPGGVGLDTLEARARNELLDLFPGLRTDVSAYGPATRPCVSGTGHRLRATG